MIVTSNNARIFAGRDGKCWYNKFSGVRCDQRAAYVTPRGVTVGDLCAGWEWCEEHRWGSDVPIVKDDTATTTAVVQRSS